MRLSERWVENVQEEYLIYLEQLDPDMCPMDYQAFEWIQAREAQQNYAEMFEE